jgi:antitoxin HicB
MIGYYAQFTPDPESDRFFTITFPDLDWGVSQGESEADGRAMALDLLRTMIDELIRQGSEIPRPKARRGARYRLIMLPALESAKLELYWAFRASGLRKADFARRVEIPKTAVDRLFHLKHHSRLDQLERAFAVLGKTLAIDIRDAA